jgi:hypothetical protein
MGDSTLVPIMSGPHRLQVHSQWLRQYGQASLTSWCSPGPSSRCSTPHRSISSPPALGDEPQQRKGVGCLVGLLVGLVAVVLIVIVGIALSS